MYFEVWEISRKQWSLTHSNFKKCLLLITAVISDVERCCWIDSLKYVIIFHLFMFLCCPIMYLYVLSSVLWCPLRFPHKNDVRFVFTSSCFAWCLMSYLRDLCLHAYSGVCFLLLVFVLCLMWPLLPVSLDCPFRCSLTFFQQITYICAIK